LSNEVVALVLIGALLHACWNTVVKSGADKALDTALIHALSSVASLPLLAWAGPPPAAALPFLGLSVLIHLMYYTALVGAYEHGDLGITYPIMRGAGPLLVAVLSSLVLAEVLNAIAWLGVLAVCAGVLMLAHAAVQMVQPRAIGFALLNAAIIAVYTLVDALGARSATDHGGNTLQYVALLFALDGWPYALIVLRKRTLLQALGYARQRIAWSVLGALASLASYAIALWAMTRAPVATVAALRETSVLFAFALGVLLLGERLSLGKIAGTMSVLLGVVALRMS
jgi:phosphonate utilization associated putative membrane protein